jgi:hypothetical protein
VYQTGQWCLIVRLAPEAQHAQGDGEFRFERAGASSSTLVGGGRDGALVAGWIVESLNGDRTARQARMAQVRV